MSNRRKKATRAIPDLIFALLLSTCGFAQVTTVNDTASTPIVGSGHDLIRMLNEVVNPANGSVSLRFDLGVPPGRGLTLPFAIAYDSNAQRTLTDIGGPIIKPDVQTLPFSQYGWSYILPAISLEDVTVQKSYGGSNYNCEAYTYYVFLDPSGGRHNLDIGGANDDQNACQNYNKLQGGDAHLQASMDASSFPPTVNVATFDGTVYHFGGNPSYWPLIPLSGVNFIRTSVAQSIEDRNGNLITINSNSTQGNFSVSDTVGRNLISSSTFGAATDQINVAGFSNGYKVAWSNISGSNFNLQLVRQEQYSSTCVASGQIVTGNGNGTYVTSITLPDGLQYQFQYNTTYGLLNEIIYPTGAWVKYDWAINPQYEGGNFTDPNGNLQRTCGYHYDWYAVAHRHVSFDGVNEVLRQDFTYSVSPDFSTKQTTVTTNDLVRNKNFTTTYTYTGIVSGNEPTETVPYSPSAYDFGSPVEQQIVENDFNGSTLRTTAKQWTNDANLLLSETVTMGGLTSETFYNHLGAGCQQQYGWVCIEPVTGVSEYGWGSGAPGSLVRKTVTNYATFGNTPIYSASPSILNRPCQTMVYDGSGNRYAETDYLYDGGASVCGSPGSAATSGVGGLNSGSITTHDEPNYSSGSNAPRGNATSVTQQCFLPPGGQACAQPNLTTNYSYDETGQVLSKTDPAGNQTQYSYADSYTDTTPPVNTNAYVTTITEPSTSGVQHIERFSYAYSDGKTTVATDQNGKQTSYSYADSLRRLTEVDYADGGKTTYNYHNDSLPLTATATRLATPDPSIVTSTVYGGFGQVTQTSVDSDPDGAVYTNSSYDGRGLLYTQSNPHRSGSSPTDGTTTYGYDALARVNSAQHPDNTVVSTTYNANCITVTDEASHSRESCSDALGRLTTVIEPNPSSGQLGSGAYNTYYTYDPLDDLGGVNQQGDGTLPARNRSYSYDSLARLVSATNPESGTISYTYDTATDCPSPNASAGELIKRVDGRGIRTCYQYDALHRSTNKNYTDGTATVNYFYDQGSYNGLTTTNGVGRRTGMSDGTGQTAWSYDAVGNVLTKLQTINGVTNAISHIYNVNRAVDSLTSPNGEVYAYTYNASGQPLSLADNGIGATYAQNAHYAPPGELVSANHGLNLVVSQSNSYNNRLQPTLLSVGAPSETVMSLSYNWSLPAGNNGSVYQIQNNLDTTRSVQFGYDYLNRLSNAGTYNASTWGDAYVYDAFGNLLQENPTQGTAENLQVTVNANNHINTSGFTYDTGGDLTWDGNNALNFDAEGHVNPVTGFVYSYDGDGRRVEKNYQGTITYYWYDDDSKVISTTGNLWRDYVYFNGKRLAYYSPSSGNQHYYWSDHLGSTGVMSNSSGSTIEWEADYYPFGTPNVFNNYLQNYFRFADYEWDPEMSYYYVEARELSPNLGRFFSPDTPLIDQQPEDPQSWNLYTYVRNNPLANRDPTGETCQTNATDGTVYDDLDGKGCAEVDQADQNASPSATVTADGSSVDSQSIVTMADLNPANDRAPLAFQGFVNFFLNGQIKRGGTQLLLGLGAAAVLDAFSLAKNGGQIVITAGRLKHVTDLHTIAKFGAGGKSAFAIGEDIVVLIRSAESTAPVAQAGGNFERVVDAGRIVGVTREGNPTTIYTVITNSRNELVTAFPGTP